MAQDQEISCSNSVALQDMYIHCNDDANVHLNALSMCNLADKGVRKILLKVGMPYFGDSPSQRRCLYIKAALIETNHLTKLNRCK